MPRKPRVLVDGGYYHVVTRGIDRRRLFCYQQDYKYFLGVMKKYLTKFEINIIHYCLMANHLHLLIQAKKSEDLPKFMQAILQVYASYFRKKYHSVGFVFQNRYKSCFIDKDSYLLECARYIERNPLRAKVVDDLCSYPWSSFPFYAKGRDDGIIKLVNPLYFELAQNEEERCQIYQKRVLEERPYEHIVDKAFRV